MPQLRMIQTEDENRQASPSGLTTRAVVDRILYISELLLIESSGSIDAYGKNIFGNRFYHCFYTCV